MTPPPLRLSPAASAWFDGLRLGAAQAVLLGHSFDFFGWHSSLDDPTHLQIQRLAVSVFFLLSGFLIPYSVSRRRGSPVLDRGAPRYTFGAYFIDRASRIYAGLIPALLLIALIDRLPFDAFGTDFPAAPSSHSLLTWVANLLQLQEYPSWILAGWSVPVFGTGDPLWSLAVEWWLYMAFGTLVLRPRSVLGWLLGGVGLLSVIHNLFGGTGDGIVLVWLLGWLVFESWKRFAIRSLAGHKILLGAAAISFALAVAAAANNPQSSHFGLDLPFAVLFAAAILFLLLAVSPLRAEPARARKRKTPMTKLLFEGASYSYTLYLTHFSILAVLYQWRTAVSPPAMVAIALITANAAAWSIARAGEGQTAKLRLFLHQRLGM